jgi:hypothetical protein
VDILLTAARFSRIDLVIAPWSHNWFDQASSAPVQRM